ncbi:MAG: hypothetical protein FWD57_08325 [Polyangiaceae bacterium]|nr:hypothetical protein [Polyangiaceae bacterium]
MKLSNLLIAICISIPVVACGKDDASDRESADGAGATGGIPASGGTGDGGTGDGGNGGGGDGGSGGSGSGDGTGGGVSGGGTGGDPSCVNDGNFANCMYPGSVGACRSCNECYCTGACVDIFLGGPQPYDAQECFVWCGSNEDCQKDCYDEYPELNARFDNWFSCLAKNCSSPCDIEPCHLGQNDPSMKACRECFSKECTVECSATHPSGVNALNKCLSDCGSDNACADACVSSPSAEAAYAFMECMDEKCHAECYK